MSSIIFFFIFIVILSIILLSVNFIFAPHNPYKEKKTPFECGYHSFLFQTRAEFSISFFLYALVFLVLDLEIVSVYPFVVSFKENDLYGLTMVILFILIVSVGFMFELGKNALEIESKQTLNMEYKSNRNEKSLKPLESRLVIAGGIVSYLQKNKNSLCFMIFSCIIIGLAKIYIKEGLFLGIFLVVLIKWLVKKVNQHFSLGYCSFSKQDIIIFFVIFLSSCFTILLLYLVNNYVIELLLLITSGITLAMLPMEGLGGETFKNFKSNKAKDSNMESNFEKLTKKLSSFFMDSSRDPSSSEQPSSGYLECEQRSSSLTDAQKSDILNSLDKKDNPNTLHPSIISWIQQSIKTCKDVIAKERDKLLDKQDIIKTADNPQVVERAKSDRSDLRSSIKEREYELKALEFQERCLLSQSEYTEEQRDTATKLCSILRKTSSHVTKNNTETYSSSGLGPEEKELFNQIKPRQIYTTDYIGQNNWSMLLEKFEEIIEKKDS